MPISAASTTDDRRPSAGASASADRPVRDLTVLHSLHPPDGTTQFVDQMVEGAPGHVRIEFFSWRTALTGRYDVFHVHWPELLIRRRSAVRRFLLRRALDVLMLRLRVQRIPLVWTAHNVEPHERGEAGERRSLARFTKAVDLVVRLNPTTVPPVGAERAEVITVLHGHYRSSLSAYPAATAQPGRLLYFGIIRPYKGVPHLIDCFAQLADPELTLRIVGKPHAGQGEIIEAATHADPRVTARLEFVDDDVVVDEVTASELVVLPYREQMHNSGVLLAALSLGRPVLVPASPTNQALADEVGAPWIIQYEGDLDAAKLEAGLAAARRIPAGAEPDLGLRDWEHIGRQLADGYRDAIERLRA
ncbi:beta-1,4-mannosyltransferase [Agromyces terreus]|uniref:Beta-1,4-mannosyltransferase n=1 Tax=Agromyces terreus TaxID=424795 RepID=A0A9X2GYF1_9MICO|nr:glycosyltransferase [Agromyces terreus]MCP2369455.1 beta-1,4-mannosyltransferase [Agromyces terreus]